MNKKHLTLFLFTLCAISSSLHGMDEFIVEEWFLILEKREHNNNNYFPKIHSLPLYIQNEILNYCNPETSDEFVGIIHVLLKKIIGDQNKGVYKKINKALLARTCSKFLKKADGILTKHLPQKTPYGITLNAEILCQKALDKYDFFVKSVCQELPDDFCSVDNFVPEYLKQPTLNCCILNKKLSALSRAREDCPNKTVVDLSKNLDEYKTFCKLAIRGQQFFLDIVKLPLTYHLYNGYTAITNRLSSLFTKKSGN